MTEKITDKISLRREIREKRASLPAFRQHLASFSLARRVVLATPRINHAKKMAFYLAQEGEISLLPLIAYCLRLRRQCFLPVLSGSNENTLGFARWIPGEPMSVNRFGIAEPHVSQHELFSAAEMDIIFMPLVAFDTMGHRLGMGGGYYDRSLAACSSSEPYVKKRPLLVATGHDIQCVPEIPVEDWDIVPDITVTPGGIIRPRMNGVT